MLTLGPAFPHTESSGKQTLVAIRSLVQVLVPLEHGAIKLLLEKEQQSHRSPGEEGSHDCKGQLSKMVCVKFSPPYILLSKRTDLEVLSLSTEDVLLYTARTTKINLPSKRSCLLN